MYCILFFYNSWRYDVNKNGNWASPKSQHFKDLKGKQLRLAPAWRLGINRRRDWDLLDPGIYVLSTFETLIPSFKVSKHSECYQPCWSVWLGSIAHINGSEVVYLSDLDFLNWSALSALCPQDASIFTEGQTWRSGKTAINLYHRNLHKVSNQQLRDGPSINSKQPVKPEAFRLTAVEEDSNPLTLACYPSQNNKTQTSKHRF